MLRPQAILRVYIIVFLRKWVRKLVRVATLRNLVGSVYSNNPSLRWRQGRRVEPWNKSPLFAIAFLSQLNSTHSCLYLAWLYLLSLYVCTYLNQKSNWAPQLLFYDESLGEVQSYSPGIRLHFMIIGLTLLMCFYLFIFVS